jgi:hypothetical protein
VWVRNYRHCAERKADLGIVRRVLERCPDLLDPDKPDEQADPYVLAVALDLKTGGFDVCVVTDDRRDRLPTKLSLATAAGMFQVPKRAAAFRARRSSIPERHSTNEAGSVCPRRSPRWRHGDVQASAKGNRGRRDWIVSRLMSTSERTLDSAFTVDIVCLCYGT